MPRMIARAFYDQANGCETDDELRALVEAAWRDIGFEYFAVLQAQSLSRPAPELFRLDNYPSAWAQRVIGRRLFRHDPVLQACLRANRGFAWTDLWTIIPNRPRYRIILDAAARAGLTQGYTVPANVPFEPAGSCHFATRRTRTIPDWKYDAAELMGGITLLAARRIHGWTRFPDAELHFSPRERDVLDWIAAGKSNTDIATILGISLGTVKVYVSSAIRKLGATDRTRASLLAARYGLVHVEAPFTRN